MFKNLIQFIGGFENSDFHIINFLTFINIAIFPLLFLKIGFIQNWKSLVYLKAIL